MNLQVPPTEKRPADLWRHKALIFSALALTCLACLLAIFYTREHIRIYGNPSTAEIAQVKKMTHHLIFDAGKPDWVPAILEKPVWIPVQSFILDFRQPIDVIRREPDGSFVVWYRLPGITTPQKVTFKKQYGQWREESTFPW